MANPWLTTARLANAEAIGFAYVHRARAKEKEMQQRDQL